jgi:integrase
LCQCAKTYKGLFDNWVRPRWETYLVTDFENPATRAAVEQWLRGLLKSASQPDGLAGKSVREIHNVMRLAFKFAVKWGYIKDNPLADKKVELPRGSAKRRRRPTQLTPAMFFYLLLRLGPLAKLAVSCVGWLGPRRSEPFGLKWADVNLERGEVTFRQGVVQGRITPLKTEASRTTLSIPEDVLELLKGWRSMTPYSHAEDWVFASPYTRGNRPYWPDTLLKKHIQPIAQEAGFPRLGWHSFRHSLSAWAKQSHIGLDAVKTLLRHQDLATTSQIYGEWELGEIRLAQQQVIEYVKKRAAEEGWIGSVEFEGMHGADSGMRLQ